MQDELNELREAITSGDYSQAFAIIDELDEMSRSDKINKIHSYMRVRPRVGGKTYLWTPFDRERAVCAEPLHCNQDAASRRIGILGRWSRAP